MILAKFFTIHVNLHMMEFVLIFGETNFAEVTKFRRKSALLYVRALGQYIETLQTINKAI